MFQAAFMFRPGRVTGEFEAFTARINERAAEISGFLGEEAWRSPDTGLRLAVYYWADRSSGTPFTNRRKPGRPNGTTATTSSCQRSMRPTATEDCRI